MKLFNSILLSSMFLAASAFGVKHTSAIKSRSATSPLAKPALVPTLRKNEPGAAESSALFRDPTAVRGGAVPGWAAYNEQLDKNPLTAKACTSLVGWALGDLLAQVSRQPFKHSTRKYANRMPLASAARVTRPRYGIEIPKTLARMWLGCV